MKNLLKLVMLTLLLVLIYNCQTSNDEDFFELEAKKTIEAEVVNTKTYSIVENTSKERKKTNVENTQISSRQKGMIDDNPSDPSNQGSDPVEISIVFKSGITEETKNEIREYAIKHGYIISWEECTSDSNIDIWLSRCTRCLTEIEKDEDIEKVLFYNNCDD